MPWKRFMHNWTFVRGIHIWSRDFVQLYWHCLHLSDFLHICTREYPNKSYQCLCVNCILLTAFRDDFFLLSLSFKKCAFMPILYAPVLTRKQRKLDISICNEYCSNKVNKWIEWILIRKWDMFTHDIYTCRIIYACPLTWRMLYFSYERVINIISTDMVPQSLKQIQV